MLTIFAVVYGLDFIATAPPTVKFTVNEFGREMEPAVFWLDFCCTSCGGWLNGLWRWCQS
jgi:hypothetical protein